MSTKFKFGPMITNSLLELTEPDSIDVAKVWVLNFLEAAIKGVGSVIGPAGAFATNLVCGIFSKWTVNPPPSLNAQFAQLVLRVAKTCEELDKQLASYCEDLKNPQTVQTTWDTQFTYDGQTSSMSDLAKTTFPEEGETAFYPLVDAAGKAFDQQIWKQMLVENYWVTGPITQRLNDYTDPNTYPTSWEQDLLRRYKYTYYHSFFHPSAGGGCAIWIGGEYDISKKGEAFGVLNDDCCDYIFIDTPDKTDPDKLFYRKEVFDFLGIVIPPDNDLSLSKEYQKAKKEGKTLLALFNSQGRAAIENRIVQRAQDDAAFAQALVKDPKSTSKSFLTSKFLSMFV